MYKLALAAGLASAVIAGSAFGAHELFTIDGQGLDLTPIDDLYDGSLGSMAAMTLSASGVGAITDVWVSVDIAHTWAGDLTIKLQSPAGTVVDLVSRAGFAEAADDGTGCCGESSDLAFGNVYQFDDSGVASSETMGSGGEDPIDSFLLYSSGFGNEFGLTSLDGEDGNGTWTLYVGDSAGGDFGILDGFTVAIASMPAPGALALLGLAGVAGTRRRRG